jgi:predicted RNA binding protein YcfA (HicA-like mRNA interferase family)
MARQANSRQPSQMEKDGRVIPISVHGTADIGKGLLADIERQTGIKLK